MSNFFESLGKKYSPLYQAVTDFRKGGGGAKEFAKDIGKDVAGAAQMMAMGGFKNGGRVTKTGMYKLHKGEHVLTAKQAKKLSSWGR